MRLTDISMGAPVGLPLPKLTHKVADSPASAPGWREIDVVYSCIPDAAYPWDPVVMRMIQEFAPDAVPMWIHWVFLSPHATGNPQITVFGRHALGRRIRNLTSELEPFRCLMPTMPCQGLSFEQPNRIWFIHEGSRDQRAADLPGTFLPFDSSILDRARRNAIGFRMTEKEFAAHMREEFIENERRARELRRKQLREDMEYRQQDFERYARGQLDKVSEVEARDYVDAKNRRLIEEPRKIAVVVP